MRASDWLIDLGPGGGEEGGKLLFMETPKEMKESDESVTGIYCKGIRSKKFWTLFLLGRNKKK